MHQTVLDALDSWQWRSCRRDWDGTPITDPSLPTQTRHGHSNPCKVVGWYYWDPPAYAVLAVEVFLMAQNQNVDQQLGCREGIRNGKVSLLHPHRSYPYY